MNKLSQTYAEREREWEHSQAQEKLFYSHWQMVVSHIGKLKFSRAVSNRSRQQKIRTFDEFEKNDETSKYIWTKFARTHSAIDTMNDIEFICSAYSYPMLIDIYDNSNDLTPLFGAMTSSFVSPQMQ